MIESFAVDFDVHLGDKHPQKDKYEYNKTDRSQKKGRERNERDEKVDVKASQLLHLLLRGSSHHRGSGGHTLTRHQPEPMRTTTLGITVYRESVSSSNGFPRTMCDF